MFSAISEMFSAIIVLPVVALLVALYFVRGKERNVVALPVTVVLTFVATAMIGLVTLVSSPASFSRFEKDRAEIVPSPTSTVANSSLVRLVNIKGISYYFFYKRSNGGKMSERIRTDSTVLYKDVQGKGSSAYVANLYLEKKSRGGQLFNFLVPMFMRTYIKKIGYAIHVPKGSTITE